jgi:hypothetical protein
MTSAFATDVRVLTCPQCGAPLKASPSGGQVTCGYCHASATIHARDDRPLAHVGPPVSEAGRMQSLWAQAQAYVNTQLPMEMVQLLRQGPLTAATFPQGLALWQLYIQRAKAGDFQASEFATLMTGSLSSFCVMNGDEVRQRALFETALDVLPNPNHKQVMRCNLARAAIKAGDLAAAQVWMASCNPTPVDLEADTAYRGTFAAMATARNDFQNVLAALGPTVGAVPLALPMQILCDVYRANAIEKLGNVAAAAQQLLQTATTHANGANAIQGIIKTSPFHLCPQSLPASGIQRM